MVEFSTMPSCQSGATGKGQRSGSAVGKIRKRATVMSQKLDFRRRSASTASDTLAQQGTPVHAVARIAGNSGPAAVRSFLRRSARCSGCRYRWSLLNEVSLTLRRAPTDLSFLRLRPTSFERG
jgi:hypothetical protein